MGIVDADKEKVKRALIMSFNDPNMATEILLSGQVPTEE